MKNILIDITVYLVVLAVSLSLFGCATVRRHPVRTGVIVGGVIGLTVSLATRPGSCPVTPEYPKGSGTPPCPK